MTTLRCFIIPRPRTGGTLLASMLNAHSQISFCYEVFPDLLVHDDGVPYAIEYLMGRLERVLNVPSVDALRWLERDNFRVFVARANRSGLEPSDLYEVLSRFKGQTLSTEIQRLEFIEALMVHQGKKDAVPIVGAKLKASADILTDRHPNAAFFMVVRDGRDVFASRKTKGNFSKTAQETAMDWVEGLQHFRAFYKDTCPNAHFVHYEMLVANPKQELEKVAQSINVPFEDAMVHFEKSKQALFSNAHGHLSVDQLRSGLNASSIGKWRSILSTDDIAAFEEVARSELEAFGYL